MNRTRLVPYAVLLALAPGLVDCTLVKRTGGATPTPTPAVVIKGGNELRVPGRIAFSRRGELWVLENGQPRNLTKGGRDLQPSWSPDGTTIAYVKREQSYSDILLYVVPTGDFKPLTNNRLTRGNWVFRPTWSPDGRQIAYTGDSGTWDLGLFLMNADGRNARRIASSDGFGGIDNPTWSADGRSLAVAAFRGSDKQQIWLYTIANSRWTPLTTSAEGAYDPRWSPAEDKIAYASRQDKRTDIWVMNGDGTGQHRLTSDGVARAPAFSPDGQFLAWIAEKGGSFDIWVAAVERGAEGELTIGKPSKLTEQLEVDASSGLSWLY